MKIDVVMCTWNSNKPHFIKCLKSIKKEIPIHHFILIDRFSNDGTVETVKKIFPNAIVKKNDVRLGVARKCGIELVDTQFFAFIDDDIVLCNGWFNRIMSYVDSKTGAIHGRIMPALFKYYKKWVEWNWTWEQKKKKVPELLTVTFENPDAARGSTHNTLVRTNVVKDWKPPAIISALEDHMLLRHVVKKDYTWKITSNIAVYHYNVYQLGDMLIRAKWNMAGMRLIRFNCFSLWSLIKALPKGVTKSFLASFQTREPLILLYITLYQLAFIQGWIGWNRYVEIKR